MTTKLGVQPLHAERTSCSCQSAFSIIREVSALQVKRRDLLCGIICRKDSILLWIEVVYDVSGLLYHCLAFFRRGKSLNADVACIVSLKWRTEDHGQVEASSGTIWPTLVVEQAIAISPFSS